MPKALVTPDPIDVTYSDLQKFDACKRLWYWSTYLKLRRKDEPVTGPLPFGSRIHTALEVWGKGKIDSPVDIWNSLMEHEYDFAEKQGWVDTAELDRESKVGHAILSGIAAWMDAEGFWARFETIAVEQAMKESLLIQSRYGPVNVNVQGKPDQLIRRKLDGRIFVLDWKTTAALADSVKTVMQKSPQFRIYAWLAKQQNPHLLFGGAIVILLKKVQQSKTAHPPFYGELEIPMSKYDVEEYLTRLKAMVHELLYVTNELDNGTPWRTVAPFSPSRVNCVNCPFRAPCDMMATFPAGAQDLLATEYVEHDPHDRYAVKDEFDAMLS